MTANRPDKTLYKRKAYLYKMMANPLRLEILNILARGEQPVSELAKTIGVRVSVVSQHLSLLSVVGLVVPHRRGKQVFYRIVDPHLVNNSKSLKKLAVRRG